MKHLIAYYSFSGVTEALCKKIKTDNCELLEIKETKKRGKISAYVFGCYKSLKGIPSDIQQINIDESAYDIIVLACPIWAGNLAPAGISFLKNAPLKGKKVIVIATSASGNDCSGSIKPMVTSAGADCINIYNVKSGSDVKISELLS